MSEISLARIEQLLVIVDGEPLQEFVALVIYRAQLLTRATKRYDGRLRLEPPAPIAIGMRRIADRTL